MGRVAKEAAAYFHSHGRDFAWRKERDPYRLAVAEILLQKTRAESVVNVYDKLVSTYPTAAALSNADIENLESALRPLGLSRKRATQLVGMSRIVAANGTGTFSDWKWVLVNVPGIGAYGARAIACFGLSLPLGIVDANIARIFRRVFGINRPDARAVVFQEYADRVATFSEDTRATNFGLLDVGATICIANPKCPICPLRSFCKYGSKRSTRVLLA
jgi:A/G-specific adenine glycosylase